MNRIPIGLLAAAFSLSVSTSCYARTPQWAKVVENDQSVFYYDAAYVRKNGSLVHAWVLMDFKVPGYYNDQPYQSFVALKMFDCASELIQAKTIHLYSGPMGTGDVVGSSNDSSKPPEPVAPGTMDSGLLDAVCK